MILRSRWVQIIFLFTTMLFLTACGENESVAEMSAQESGAMQDSSSNDILPLSDALEEYRVWIDIEGEDITRSSEISTILLFEKGNVQFYDVADEELILENVIDLSDEELLELARETSNKKYDEILTKATAVPLDIKDENMIAEVKRFTPEYSEKYEKRMGEPLAPIDDLRYENIFLEVPIDSPNSTLDYTLDISLDDYGQNTENMYLKIQDAIYELDGEIVRDIYKTYMISKYYPLLAYLSMGADSKENLNVLYESQIRELEEYGEFKADNGYELNHPQTFVPNPLVWKTEERHMTLYPETVSRKIFDTSFSGYKNQRAHYKGILVTKVEELSTLLKLDDPDTDKENVTIEGE